jgi:hypothetical protein
MRTLPVVALALALVSAPAVVQAQSAKPAPARPTTAQLDAAANVLRIFIGAIQSPKVEQPVKNALFGCLYQVNLAKITEGTNKVIAANPGKIDRNNPTQMLGVIAGVCGYRPAAAPAKKR